MIPVKIISESKKEDQEIVLLGTGFSKSFGCLPGSQDGCSKMVN
jgi:hypothetical protein